MRRLTANALKLNAVFAMLIDHIAWKFVPTASALGIAMHTIGRITMPIMCFFIAEGFYYTRSRGRYALRLFLFALISQIPFAYFESGSILPSYNGAADIFGSLNVMFTLLLGLFALWTWKGGLRPVLKSIIILSCFILSIASDWYFIGVGFVLIFGLNRGDFRKQALWFSAFSLSMAFSAAAEDAIQFFQAGALISLPLIYLYNGKREGGAVGKWAFYLFYPLHLIIIGVIFYY